jgi:hypothetical protein
MFLILFLLQTNVLAGERVWEMKAIQDQFTGEDIRYNIANCRLVNNANNSSRR